MSIFLPSCFLLAFSSTLLFVEATLIHSDRIIDGRNWGPLEKCPPGSFVKAINVKIKSKPSNELNAAVTAIQLSCVQLDLQVTSANFPVAKVIKSAEGTAGEFQGFKYCDKGIAVGFELRSEEAISDKDQTTVSDMKLICAGSQGRTKTPEKGNRLGSWRGDEMCPNKMAICGLETHVEPLQVEDDDMSLHNLGVLCCELPDPAQACHPTDEWEEIAQYDNSEGDREVENQLQNKVGIQTSFETYQSLSTAEELALSVGFELSASLDVLAANFESKLSSSTKTGHVWERTQTSVFAHETEDQIEIVIPPKCITTIYKIVGKCGPYVVYSNAIKRVDKCVGREAITTFGHVNNITNVNPCNTADALDSSYSLIEDRVPYGMSLNTSQLVAAVVTLQVVICSIAFLTGT